MAKELSRVLAVTCVLLLISITLIECAPGPRIQANPSVLREKRSMMWRWISLRPVGAMCKDNTECSTNNCRSGKCSLQTFSS
ncbi:liver-expressed antimicrobial peptide 2-like [Ambystoma mexicanum]|uniref:liver-expressed antimicrobial peptide 2-like n=1 Tax=Ambystoma mexicanum TaxID=8296 RepID=UPI0037E99D44